MKHLLIVLLLIVSVPVCGSAQGVLNRLKDKVKNRVDQRVDEGMERGLDKAEEEIEGKGKSGSKGTVPEKVEEKSAAGKEGPVSFKSYSRYDFVPGDHILYAEDFAQDVVGEFPLKWATNNRGEVVTVRGSENKWLRMFHGGHFVSPGLQQLPENFTIEFDLIMDFGKEENGYVYPDVQFKLLNLPPADAKAKDYLLNPDAGVELLFTLAPGEEESSTISLQSQRGGMEVFRNNAKPLKKLGSYFGQPVHFALWVQKERFRLWINGEKVYDIPQAVPERPSFNRMDFIVSSCNYDEDYLGFYLTNLKVAEGAPDMRSKLITEGKLVTHGILFDVNSDRVKPESAGVLQGIAAVLKEHAGVKVKIVGHTDSDGEDAQNRELSKRRAAAVKEVLVKEYGIEAARMQTDGLGETEPLADNATKEGKTQNRRVEFVRMSNE